MRRGFTLIEMMVVIAILGLSMVLISFANPLGNKALTDRAAVSSLLNSLKQARATAIIKQQPAGLAIDVAAKSFRLENAPALVKAISLPQRLSIKVMTAAGEITGDTVAAIRFLPDGSSSGGKIELADGQWQSEITINWLTGRISVDRDL